MAKATKKKKSSIPKKNTAKKTIEKKTAIQKPKTEEIAPPAPLSTILATDKSPSHIKSMCILEYMGAGLTLFASLLFFIYAIIYIYLIKFSDNYDYSNIDFSMFPFGASSFEILIIFGVIFLGIGALGMIVGKYLRKKERMAKAQAIFYSILMLVISILILVIEKNVSMISITLLLVVIINIILLGYLLLSQQIRKALM